MIQAALFLTKRRRLYSIGTKPLAPLIETDGKIAATDYTVNGNGTNDGFVIYRVGICGIRQTTSGINYAYFRLNSDVPMNQVQ